MHSVIRAGALSSITAASIAVATATAGFGQETASTPRDIVSRRFDELRRFTAPEARQGVAVDSTHFYAIGNREIGKYQKRNGTKVAEWRDVPDGTFVHLNAGVVVDGKLYCAHSNYPAVPMVSSIEIFDTVTLRHIGSRQLGRTDGSATWVDRRDGRWWIAFAHYSGRGGEPGKGPERTSVVAFDERWNRITSYTFPAAVVERFQPHSNSGGGWGPDKLLYVTGHDAAEMYALRLPEQGSVLELVEVVAAPIEGQAFAWDPSDQGVLWGLVRKRREVVVARLTGAKVDQ